MLLSVGLKRQVEREVERFAEDIEGGKRLAAAAEGFAAEGERGAHTLIGKQRVLDGAVIFLEGIVGLNEARKVRALIAHGDRIAQGGRLALFALGLGGAALLGQAPGLVLGGDEIGRQKLVGTQGHDHGLTNAALVLRQLFLVVHQTRDGYGLFVLRIVYAIILQLLLRKIGRKIGIDLPHVLGRQELALGIVGGDAVEELGVLERDRRIQVADEGARRHFGIRIAAHRVARLIAALDVLPKEQAAFEMLVFENGVGANDGGTHKAAAERLRKGRGEIGKHREVELLNASKGRTVTGAQLGLRLALGGLGRGRGQLNGEADTGAVDPRLSLGGVLKLGLVFKAIVLFHAAAARKGTVANGDKGRETVEQSVDKAILVGQKRFLAEDVQKTGRDHLVPLDLTDHIGVARQVLDRFFRNAACQLDRQDLLHVLDRHGGAANDGIERGHSRLDPLHPLGVYAPPYRSAAERCLGLRRADQHLRLPVILTFP